LLISYHWRPLTKPIAVPYANLLNSEYGLGNDTVSVFSRSR
jgi:hypothetical protein